MTVHSLFYAFLYFSSVDAEADVTDAARGHVLMVCRCFVGSQLTWLRLNREETAFTFAVPRTISNGRPD